MPGGRVSSPGWVSFFRVGVVVKSSSALVGVLVAGVGVGVGAPASAQAVSSPGPQPMQPVSASVAPDAFVGVSVPDIRARVRQADASRMTAQDERCVKYVKARMPKWWSPSGHTVVCRGGTTKGYDFYFDGVAVLTVNTKVGPQGWAQAPAWGAAQVAATERRPLTDAPKLCRQAISTHMGLAKRAGNYRIRCVSRITWKAPKTNVRDAAVLGYVQYGKRDIAILETRDVSSMSFITAHELGHAVSYMPKAGGLRQEVTRVAKRRTFTSDPYVGMPAEVWAESFARYWTGQNPPSVQKTRLGPAQVDRLLRRYGLPRR